MIRLRNLSCYYKVKKGFAVAVDDVSLEVAAGEFLVIMGESGCGKTTLLRAILGLCDYMEGELLIDGQSVDTFCKRDNTIAYVSQNYVLYPHLTVYENIAYPLRSSRMKQEQIDLRVRKTAKAVGLDRLLTRMPKQLSGGQQQRIAIARALVKEPKILLFDEPFSNIDPVMRRELRELIHNICKEAGQTVLYVTHDPEEARALADRVVWMHEGRITHSELPAVQAISEGAYQAVPKRRSAFFHQKSVASDFTPDMLPATRRQVFRDTVKYQGWNLFKLGLVLLLFSLPIHGLALFEDIYTAQLYAAESQPSEPMIAAHTITLQNLQAALNIPLLMLFSIGFSGAAHIVRQYAWGESVFIWYDFRKGIRQNWRHFLLLAACMGTVNFLSVYCSNLSYTTSDVLSSCVVYLPAVLSVLVLVPVSAYMTVCIPVYSNTFRQNLRLGAVLYTQCIWKTLAVLVAFGVLFVTYWIPNFYCHLAGRMITSVLIPFLMLGWYLFAFGVLDRNVNPRFFPELVGRGIRWESDT